MPSKLILSALLALSSSAAFARDYQCSFTVESPTGSFAKTVRGSEDPNVLTADTVDLRLGNVTVGESTVENMQVEITHVHSRRPVAKFSGELRPFGEGMSSSFALKVMKSGADYSSLAIRNLPYVASLTCVFN